MGVIERFIFSRGAATRPGRLMDAEPARERESGGAASMPAASKAAPVAPGAYSIFHEPWWLDITAPGQWRVVQSLSNGRVQGEMVFCTTRKGIWDASSLPPLTRTLGPVIYPTRAKPVVEFRHRLTTTYDLIDQLPKLSLFHQLLDPRLPEAMAFQTRGFTISQSYTFQIPGERTAEQVWDAIHSKTRNLIRTAQTQLTVRPIADPHLFTRFYEANLAERGLRNAYGERLMSTLVEAVLAREAGQVLGAYNAAGALVAAIMVVRDRYATYYLLSSRARTGHGGAISLLLWSAIQDALARGLRFDFDGIGRTSILSFLSGFGGDLVPRIGVERTSASYRMARGVRDASAQLAQSLRDRLHEPRT